MEWRRAFALRLTDARGRLIVPWGWVLIGALIMAATLVYDLSDVPPPHWQSQAAALTAARQFLTTSSGMISPEVRVNADLQPVFSADTAADAYANRLTAGRRGVTLPYQLPIWYWQVPLARPGAAASAGRQVPPSVVVNAATGQVVGATLPVPAVPSSSTSPQQDRHVAEAVARRLGVGSTDWLGPDEFAGAPDMRVFVWHTLQPVLGEAPETLQVKVESGALRSFQRSIQVPGAFTQDLQAQSQRGGLLVKLVEYLEIFGFLAALIWALVRQQQSHWAFGGACFVIVAGLFVEAGLNTGMVGASWHYPTATTGALVIAIILNIMKMQGMQAGWVLFGGAVGYSLAKEQWGDRVPLLSKGLGALFTLEGAVTALRTYALLVVHYQVAFWFYFIADRRLGVWEATALAFSQKLNVLSPVLYPLHVTVLAPVLEEVTWRLFSVSALRKVLRSTVLAVVLPAVVWGLAHSWYQVYPPYTRAIELALVGSVLGYAFIKWGLEVTIGSHMLYNALVTVVSLGTVPLVAHRAGAVLAGGIMLLPALPIAVQLLRQRNAPA